MQKYGRINKYFKKIMKYCSNMNINRVRLNRRYIVRSDDMNNNNDKLHNVVKLLSSLGVNIKKTKSRFEVMHTLPSTAKATNRLK